jgi:hypothetical protein
MTTLVKYFTKPLLQQAARNAKKWKYSQQLDLATINALPDDAKCPVAWDMAHEYRDCKPCEEHVRVLVELGAKGGFALVDIPLKFWDQLPETRV